MARVPELWRRSHAEARKAEIPLGLTNPPQAGARPSRHGTRGPVGNFLITPALSPPSWNGALRRSGAAGSIQRCKPKGLKSQVNCLYPGICFNRGDN